MPAGFHFAPAGDAALWLPIDHGSETRAQRFNHWVNVVGRLSDGASLNSARTSLDLVMQRLAAAYPETNRGRGIIVVPLSEVITGDLRPVLFALALAVLLVLVIACANAAGLFLSRMLGRGRELSVRLAIGATRGRIVRQLVTESLLAGVGGAFGEPELCHQIVRYAGACLVTVKQIVAKGFDDVIEGACDMRDAGLAQQCEERAQDAARRTDFRTCCRCGLRRSEVRAE